ncbi:MAG: formate dehydrogenase accessory sulfurtransferase FdhD [Microscillaceae bacterium]
MSALRIASVQIHKVNSGTFGPVEPDLLAVEEPLEIRLGYGPLWERQWTSLSVTMRTPGHDFELVAGFLCSEGMLAQPNALLSVKYCQDTPPEGFGNVVRVELHPEVLFDLEKLHRHFFTSSSCGVCGKASIASLEAAACPILPPKNIEIKASTLLQLPILLRKAQTAFDHTGGLHATALFTSEGKLLAVREDVGRHNAMDKIIGWALQRNLLPLHPYLALVSGRLSFELVQKALRAGISVLVAVGAPSSLAVQLARDFGLTLIGFLREERFNIYTHPERIVGNALEPF